MNLGRILAHINPSFPAIGDSNWGQPLLNAFGAVISQVNLHDDMLTTSATSSTSATIATVSGLATGPSAAAANGTIIQNALNANAGPVIIPVGTWYSSPLKLNTRNVLCGLGWGSILKLANGANTHFITLATPSSTEQVGIQDLWLDGNKANQTAGDVVRLDNAGYDTATGHVDGDVNHYMRRVMLRNGKEGGLRVTGPVGQGQFEDVWAYYNDGIGTYIDSPDHQFTGLIVGWSGKQGVWMTPSAASTHVNRSKVFLSGKADTANGDGWTVSYTSSVHLVDVEAQDNVGHGFALIGTNSMRLVGIADRNGTGVNFGGGAGDGLYMAGVTNSAIDLLTYDRNRSDTGLLQTHGYNFGAGNERNTVRLSVGAVRSGIAGVGTLSASSDITITSQGTSTRLPPVGISDTFDTINTQKWTTLLGTVTSVAGRARLATTAGYSDAVSDNVVPFLNRPVVVQMPTVPSAGSGTTQATFQLALGANNFGFTVQGSPQALHMKGSGLTDNSVTYSATNHQWLRLRYADGSIYWDAAPDASGVPGTWVNLSNQIAPAFVTAALMKVRLESGFYGTESGLATAYAEFDNLNLS